jgi:BirA family biotin operon repressor/biotin-[acetyl-CoA-carboxylase] ligase
VALAAALDEAGVQGLGLKWPNDLYLDGRKLAGLLVEVSGEASGPSRVVIGIGINLRIDPASASDIDQPWADLRDQLGDCPPRNRIAGRVLAQLVDTCRRYGEHGLPPFLTDWRRYDIYLGSPVQLRLGEQAIAGRYVGLNDDGNLLLETADGLRSFAGGEVSLRPAGAA